MMMNEFATSFIYYFQIQLGQIAPYYFLGVIAGSLVSVFAKNPIQKLFVKLNRLDYGYLGIFCASLLGIASPLCLYGTIPIAAQFARGGMKDDLLAAFVMSSILLNPQLLMYSAALGMPALLIRLNSCILMGFAAGVMVHHLFSSNSFFDFSRWDEPAHDHDTDPNYFWRVFKNIGRNLRITLPYFIVGIVLSVLFQIFVPASFVTKVFGGNNAWGLLMAATIGVPLYVCGGGTIPLLQEWLAKGMSLGSAAAFMLTGPATKITNLGALKMILGAKHLIYYLAFVMIGSLLTGLIVNLII